MKVSVVKEWILFILSSFIFQRSAELNAMNLCKALSKEWLWDAEGLELKNQEIKIQNGLASVCGRLCTFPFPFSRSFRRRGRRV